VSAGVDYEEWVRELWAAFERGGVAGMRPYVDDDVEWRPTDGRVIRGVAALVEYWNDVGDRRSIVPHAWEQHGECVLVHGSMREFRDGGFVETQPSWVYFFREGRLLRAVSFASREEALAAIEQHRRLSRRVAG
jgi:ketosteroid isomerase-like protein